MPRFPSETNNGVLAVMLILVLGYRYAMAVSYLRLELRRSNGWQTYTDKRLMGIPLYAWLVGALLFWAATVPFAGLMHKKTISNGCKNPMPCFDLEEQDFELLSGFRLVIRQSEIESVSLFDIDYFNDFERSDNTPQP